MRSIASVGFTSCSFQDSCGRSYGIGWGCDFSRKARSTRAWVRALCPIPLYIVAVFVARYQFRSSIMTRDYLAGAMFTLLAFSLFGFDRECPRNLYRAVAVTLSNFSYSLYVFHLPLLVFCRAWLAGD